MYYRSFLYEYRDWYNLSTNEQIVYSIILNKAILSQDVFGYNGKLDQKRIENIIDICDGYLELPKMPTAKIAEKSGISLRALTGNDGILAQLRKKGLLDKDYDSNGYILVKVEYGVIGKGYMMLPVETGLKGKQLLFWAFMLERLKHFNQELDKKNGSSRRFSTNQKMMVSAPKLAKDFGVSIKDIHNLIHQLTVRNFLKRDDDIKYLWVNTKLKNIKTTKEVNVEKIELSTPTPSVMEQQLFNQNKYRYDDDLPF